MKPAPPVTSALMASRRSWRQGEMRCWARSSNAGEDRLPTRAQAATARSQPGESFPLRLSFLGGRTPRHDLQCRKLGRSRMRYLITGGAGFIGSHLIDALTTRGDDVLVLDDLSTGRIENLDHLDRDHDRDGPPAKRFAGHSRVGAVEFVDGSVTNEAVVDDCMSSVDVCVHLASAVGVQLVVKRPLESLLSNVRGCDIVLSAAARHGRRLLFTSTSEIYGKMSGASLPESSDRVLGSPFQSRWSYSTAKAFGEILAASYHRQAGRRDDRRQAVQHGRPAADRRLRHGPAPVRPPGPERRGPDRLRDRHPVTLLHPRARHRARAGAPLRRRRRDRQRLQRRQAEPGLGDRARAAR